MTNDERITKLRMTNQPAWMPIRAFGFRAFGFLSSFVICHSVFLNPHQHPRHFLLVIGFAQAEWRFGGNRRRVKVRAEHAVPETEGGAKVCPAVFGRMVHAVVGGGDDEV